jgi:hypothetical protein
MNSNGSEQSNDGQSKERLGKQTHREDLRLPDILKGGDKKQKKKSSKERTL